MTTKTRIRQLEKMRGTREKIKYLCTSKPNDTEYKASPFVGVDGEMFTFKTQEAMKAYFDLHTEFELLHVQIVYASDAIKDDEK